MHGYVFRGGLGGIIWFINRILSYIGNIVAKPWVTFSEDSPNKDIFTFPRYIAHQLSQHLPKPLGLSCYKIPHNALYSVTKPCF